MISASVSPDHNAESHGRGADPYRWIADTHRSALAGAVRHASGSRSQPSRLRPAAGADLGWIAVIAPGLRQIPRSLGHASSTETRRRLQRRRREPGELW